jgi:hypothetical protein
VENPNAFLHQDCWTIRVLLKLQMRDSKLNIRERFFDYVPKGEKNPRLNPKRTVESNLRFAVPIVN